MRFRINGIAPPLFHRTRLRILQSISYRGSPPLEMEEGVWVCVCAHAKRLFGFQIFYQKYFVCKFLECCVCIVSSGLHVDRTSKFIYGSVLCLNTFAAGYLDTQGLNNSCLKSPTSTLVDLTFQSRALHSFSLNQLRNLSL